MHRGFLSTSFSIESNDNDNMILCDKVIIQKLYDFVRYL